MAYPPHVPPPPGRPIRTRSVLLGILTPVVLFSALNGIAALMVPQGEDAAINAFFVYLPIGIVVLSVLTLVGGVLMIVLGDRGFGIGLLCGWALGVIVGGGVCLAVLGVTGNA